MQIKSAYCKNKCSIRIFVPNKIKITPPISSEICLLFMPNLFPILKAIDERIKVVIPIIVLEENIFTFKNAKETPTAIASMLVAIPSENKDFKLKPWLISQLASFDYLIIWNPIINNKIKATQWSIALIEFAKLDARK